MSWFDDLLNLQLFQDGIALPRRQIVDVTFPGVFGPADGSNDGTLVDDGAVADQHRLLVPSYRPYWPWFMTAAPAVAALRYVRPYRDIYDSAANWTSQAFVVPKTFIPYYLGWQCAGSALTDAISFTVYKNGVATALTLNIPANQSGTNNDIFQANSTNIQWNRGDRIGLGVTQAGVAVQAAWNAIVVLQ